MVTYTDNLLLILKPTVSGCMFSDIHLHYLTGPTFVLKLRRETFCHVSRSFGWFAAPRKMLEPPLVKDQLAVFRGPTSTEGVW